MLAAQSRECHADPFRLKTREQKIRWLGLLCDGSERTASSASRLRYTILPSPFFVCGNMARLPFRSRSNHRSLRISERRIPVATPKAMIGRSHSGAASMSTRKSPGWRYRTRPGAAFGAFTRWAGFTGMYSHSSTARRSRCLSTLSSLETVAAETSAPR